MHAFKVVLNGEKVCVAGLLEDGVLSIIVNDLRRGKDEDLFFNVVALTSRASESLEWVRQRTLRLGDRVEIEIVEAISLDEPERRVSPMERQQSKEEHVRKLVDDLGWKLQTCGRSGS